MISCPVCREEMAVLNLHGLELDECRFCDGLWLDRNEPERLSGMDLLRKGMLQPIAFDDSRKVVPRADQCCPRCHENFEQHRLRGLTLDVCPECRGLWLQRWGLQKLLAD